MSHEVMHFHLIFIALFLRLKIQYFIRIYGCFCALFSLLTRSLSQSPINLFRTYLRSLRKNLRMEFMIILIIIIDDIREMTYHPRYSHISSAMVSAIKIILNSTIEDAHFISFVRLV